MARKDKLFADTGAKADRKDREAATRSHDRCLASLERLMKNADFRDWMFGTLYTLCAYEHDLRETTDFERGIRAAGSLIRRELLEADGAPEFFASLDKRYFEGVRRGILDARRKQETPNEGTR